MRLLALVLILCLFRGCRPATNQRSENPRAQQAAAFINLESVEDGPPAHDPQATRQQLLLWNLHTTRALDKLDGMLAQEQDNAKRQHLHEVQRAWIDFAAECEARANAMTEK